MDEALLVSPIQFHVVVFGSVSNAVQVRLHGRYGARLGYLAHGQYRSNSHIDSRIPSTL